MAEGEGEEERGERIAVRVGTEDLTNEPQANKLLGAGASQRTLVAGSVGHPQFWSDGWLAL